MPLADTPDTIELVVRIDAVAVFEVGKKRLAACFDIANTVPAQLSGIVPQSRLTETYRLDGLSFEDISDLIRARRISGPSGI